MLKYFLYILVQEILEPVFFFPRSALIRVAVTMYPRNFREVQNFFCSYYQSGVPLSIYPKQPGCPESAVRLMENRYLFRPNRRDSFFPVALPGSLHKPLEGRWCI